MHPLDDPQIYRRLDPQGMIDLVARFPAMGTEAWEAGLRLQLPPGPHTTVVILGMGGSGVGGDLLAALLRPAFPLPVVVVKDSRVPGFVGPQTLVFACSYSGDTEETISAYTAARQAGAPAIVITSGGTLEGLAAAHGDAVVPVPRGIPPRAALPYLFLPMVGALRYLLPRADLPGEWAEAHAVLEELAGELGRDVPTDRNPAKQLAQRLVGHLPAVYAATSDLGAVAYRWKSQLGENGKVLALWHAFSELNHNETVGWEDQTLAGRVAVVLLREPEEEPEVTRRIAATREVSFRAAASVSEVTARGRGRLARLLSLVLFGDFVSVYLALLRGVDPTPVPPIDAIKRRLRG
ncbi:MAG: bifunctional phosphoglucose/phosphomannose isomerase [Armatimonadota bacterium]|nr:bifunctional phosphoglucose/phosphomannose isomerase [Armatimonadota bacterium]